MPTSILPQDQDGQELYNAISSFFSNFHIGRLLRKCNAQKEKGVPVIQIFKYNSATCFPTAACTCSRKQARSRNLFPRILSTVS